MELSFLGEEKLLTPMTLSLLPVKKDTPTGNVTVRHTARVISSVCSALAFADDGILPLRDSLGSGIANFS